MSPVRAYAQRAPQRSRPGRQPFDRTLLLTVGALLGVGLVMIGSASVGIAERHAGDPLYYLYRQLVFAGAGLGLALLAARIPLTFWERVGPVLLLGSFVFLVALLVPGLGRTVNGSTRWLMVGPFSLQVSEFVKLALVIYLAGYLVRHGEAVRTTVTGFLTPMLVIGMLGTLLLAQPDFGAAAVLAATALGMMFLGGVRLWLFGVLVTGAVALFGLLAISSPYRLERLTAFTNPWADPFNSGFQLTQALIAFGRGEVTGVGLGSSVQKLFYLPEAHTDFVFAVLAEELGLIGVLVVIGLYALFIVRAFTIGRRSEVTGRPFGAHLAYGIGIWFALQALVNMGVNMGLLPTKGLTLPLMSYGGSSVLVTLMAIGLLLRVDHETRHGSGHDSGMTRRGAP